MTQNVTQNDTPKKFKDEIEAIREKPLSIYLTKHGTFSSYMNNLCSILDCCVPYKSRDTRTNFTGTRTWRYQCCFGGRSRRNKYKSKKKHQCESFIEFTVTRNQSGYSLISFKCANWLHTHPLDTLFLEANGIISKARVDEIKMLTMKGWKAKNKK